MKDLTVAYLGPSGSHTELALAEHLNPSRTIPAFSIPEVFRLLSEGKAECGFVPVENMLQGPVTETLDLLLEYKGRVYIDHCYLAAIKHYVGVLPAGQPAQDRTQEITQVYSREQALRQCSGYIREHFPQAELCCVESTGAAAELVKEKGLKGAAVISAYEKLHDLGFEIFGEDIADVSGNKTRFVLLRTGDVRDLLTSQPPQKKEEEAKDKPEEQYVTSIVIDPGRDRQGLLYEILQVISIQHQVNLLSIHSRPDTRGGFVFHLDLEGHYAEHRIRDCLQALDQYCLDSTGKTAEIIVCGSYKRARFHTPPFHTIGIVGGEGKMGQWFTEFFRAAGFQVRISDKDSKLTLKELARHSDVILLSIPMSAASSVSEELCGYLRGEQLLVENCSIKSCVLPTLLESAPKGVEVLGIHTMFGGDVPTLRGENVIITKTSKCGNKAKAFEDLLYKYGAVISYASVEEHDQIVAFLQALIQFSMIGLGEVMRKSFKAAGTVEPFSTPNSRAVLQTISKVLGQSDELLADLQLLNDQYPEIRRRFLDASAELSSALDKGDTQTFLKLANRIRRFVKAE